jgi:NTE family protein
MKVGLVLGGGGAVGMAYHAGALAVLEHDLGWDPRSAEVIVGTSAGSVVGSMLRRGIPASDLAALAVGASTTETPAELAAAIRGRGPIPGPRLRSLLRPPRVPSPALVTRWLARPWRLDPVLAFTGLLADGTVDLLEHSAEHAAAMGDAWPDDALWLCVVRQHDLRRIVFGRDSKPALPSAVLASCAVPGYFRPVDVDGTTYIDGGVRSPTNADVLRNEDLDLVIIVSPMSGRDLPRLDPSSWIRRYAKAKVDAEVASLLLRRIPAVVIEPGPELTPVLGTDFMNAARTNEIVAGSFVDAGEQLGARLTRTLVAGIDRRRWDVRRRSDEPATTSVPGGSSPPRHPAPRHG